MTDTISNRLNLNLQGSGTHSNAWGQILNLNLNRLEVSAKGFIEISVTGALSLTNSDITNENSIAKDNSYYHAIEFTGTHAAGTIVTVEAQEMVWHVVNNSTNTIVFTPSGGTGTTLAVGAAYILCYVTADTAFTDFGKLLVNAGIVVDDTTDSTSGTTGSIHTDGGVGIAKALYVGTTGTFAGDVTINGTGNDTVLFLGGTATGDRGILRLASAPTDSPFIDFWQGGNQRAWMQYQNSGSKFIIDSDGTIEFNPNNANALILDTSGNATFAGAVSINGAKDIYSNGGTGYFRLQAAAGSNTFPTYTFDGDNNTGMHRPSADAIRFVTGGSAVLDMDSSQNATFAGDVILSSGKGVNFTDTFSNATDGNTLDDYEEGSFSPTIVGSSVAGSPEYAGGRLGVYQKIGNRVFFNLYVAWNALGGATGQTLVGNLPFTSNTTALSYSSISVRNAGHAVSDIHQQLQAIITNNTNYIQIEEIGKFHGGCCGC